MQRLTSRRIYIKIDLHPKYFITIKEVTDIGIVFDIQRCSYHDGPGIRSTVFFKGCNLRCPWCHNPESFLMKPQLQFIDSKCINCGLCENVCPNKVHSFPSRQQTQSNQSESGLDPNSTTHQIDFAKCKLTGECVKACPTGALSIIGREMSADEVIEIVLKDLDYYKESGGGVTFSGGEPTLQPEFLLELLMLSKKHNLHTCLESNGYVSKSVLEDIIPYLDLILLDYKTDEADKLSKIPGTGDGKLWFAALEYIQAAGKPVILRMPIIPGFNDNPEHFVKAKALKSKYSVIQKIEIMPYHLLGQDKWERIGLDYPLKGLPAASRQQAELWRRLISD